MDTTHALIDSFTAAELLNVPHRLLMRLARAKLLPCYRLPDDHYRFDARELIEWLATRRQLVEDER